MHKNSDTDAGPGLRPLRELVPVVRFHPEFLSMQHARLAKLVDAQR